MCAHVPRATQHTLADVGVVTVFFFYFFLNFNFEVVIELYLVVIDVDSSSPELVIDMCVMRQCYWFNDEDIGNCDVMLFSSASLL